MDKQIIIDVCPYQGECSVSGCKRDDDSCFVRQLFEERDRAENRIVEFNKTIQAKEQECEELKVQNIKYMNGNISYQLKNSLYKQTLTEIKEIVEGNCELCLSVDGFKKTDDCGICEYAKILQKISECEVEDDNK